jgi:virginiamycin B lyase
VTPVKERTSMRTSDTLRASAIGLAALLSALSQSALGVKIEELLPPVPVSSPWGIAFTPFNTRYVVGGGVYTAQTPVLGVSKSTFTDLRDVAFSPNGDGWAVEPSTNTIWRYRFFDDLFIPYSVNGEPTGISRGSDGNIWFTEYTGNKIGRISVATGTVTEFTIPTAASHPSAIVLGPEGNLWFVEATGNKVGRVTPAGAITDYALLTPGAYPAGIAASPLSGGTLAITEPGADKIAFFSIGSLSVFSEVSVPTGLSSARGIAFGQDGFFWFLESGTGKVGRTGFLGPAIEFPLPAAGSLPRTIAAAPDGDLWFTEQGTGKLGHIAFDPSGDVNYDHKIDVNDVFYLINYLFAGGPAPK